MNVSDSPGRWVPAPFIVGSGVLHLAATALAVVRPQWWPYALESVVANHLLLAGAGLWPRSHLLGANWTHLPASRSARIALTIDDGPEPDVTPRVLDLLDAYACKATFFAIGERVERYPELAREIVKRGHALENHSYRHSALFSLLGPWRLQREIDRAQQTIAAVAGERPLFFRAPAGLRNPFLDPVLTRLGLHLASWTRRGFDTLNAQPASVLGKLTRKMQTGDIVLLHDGHSAKTREGSAVILEVLPALLRAFASAGLKPVTLREALA